MRAGEVMFTTLLGGVTEQSPKISAAKARLTVWLLTNGGFRPVMTEEPGHVSTFPRLFLTLLRGDRFAPSLLPAYLANNDTELSERACNEFLTTPGNSTRIMSFVKAYAHDKYPQNPDFGSVI
jgi:hypothetical protein